jgi:hypothetical protein
MDESQRQIIERAMRGDIFVLDNPHLKCYLPRRYYITRKESVLGHKTEIYGALAWIGDDEIGSLCSNI